MNARLKVLGAVLRKDLRQFWSFALLAAVLVVLVNIRAILEVRFWIEILVSIAVLLATSLFTLLVFHEDSAVSGKRDWLTRPVPGMTMLAAKSLFVVLVIVPPAVLGEILNGLLLGLSPVEMLVAGMTNGFVVAGLLTLLIGMSLAALTSNILQAFLAVLAGFVTVMVSYGTWVASDLAFESGVADSLDSAAGSAWILAVPLESLGVLTALAVLWMLYRRPHGRRAALVLVGMAALAGGTFITAMSWSRMFGLQKWLSPDPAAATSIAISLPPGCFSTPPLLAYGETTAGTTGRIPVGIFAEEQRARAGVDAVAIAVRLVADQVPESGQLLLDRAELSYRTPDGAAVFLGTGRAYQRWVQKWKIAESGQQAIDQYWLLSKKDYQRLAADPGTTVHFDFSLSLLEPRATAVFAVDGRRAWRSGIGYCGATAVAETNSAHVDCFRVGEQPARLAARLDGQPGIEDHASGHADYTPAIFDLWGSRHHHMDVADADASPVRVTAYEARAHFTRQIDVPGVLGGPVSSCPLP